MSSKFLKIYVLKIGEKLKFQYFKFERAQPKK